MGAEKRPSRTACRVHLCLPPRHRGPAWGEGEVNAVFGGCYFNGRFAPEIPDEDGICGEEEQKPQKSPQHNVPLRGAYPAFASTPTPSRTLRPASKCSEGAA